MFFFPFWWWSPFGAATISGADKAVDIFMSIAPNPMTADGVVQFSGRDNMAYVVSLRDALTREPVIGMLGVQVHFLDAATDSTILGVCDLADQSATAGLEGSYHAVHRGSEIGSAIADLKVNTKFHVAVYIPEVGTRVMFEGCKARIITMLRPPLYGQL